MSNWHLSVLQEIWLHIPAVCWYDTLLSQCHQFVYFLERISYSAFLEHLVRVYYSSAIPEWPEGLHLTDYKAH